MEMKSHCNQCGGSREHKILHEHEEDRSEEIDEYFTFHWGETYRLLQCAGCETISMREDSWNSENTDHEGRPIETTKFLPPRIFRPKPKWMDEKEYISGCPEQIQSLLNETYICLQNDCRSSAAMCVRAVFEAMMIEKIRDHGAFIKNLDEFENQNFITKTQRKIIWPVLDAGHATNHRGYIPKVEAVITLVDVVENIVSAVYVYAGKVANLEKEIPPKKTTAAVSKSHKPLET